MSTILVQAGGVQTIRIIFRVRGTGAAPGTWHAAVFKNGNQIWQTPFTHKDWQIHESPTFDTVRTDAVDLRVYSLPGEANAPAEIDWFRIENLCQIGCETIGGGVISGTVPGIGAPCDPCGGDFGAGFDPGMGGVPGFDEPIFPPEGGPDFVDPGGWDPSFDVPLSDLPPWENPIDPFNPGSTNDFQFIPDPTGADNVLSDVIPAGVGHYDEAFYAREFVTVPSWTAWSPTDQVHVLGIDVQAGGTESITEMPGVYLRSGAIYGTHAATGGTALTPAVKHCVETRVVVNGADKSIDQTVWLDGSLIGAVANADPDATREPPQAVVTGVGGTSNQNIVISIDDPAWNLQQIGCVDTTGPGLPGQPDVIMPGDPGYPWTPTDPEYGQPYYPPVSGPLFPGDPGYPYVPTDPQYGDPYFPTTPPDAGGVGTVTVAITQPVDGTTVSASPVVINITATDSSVNGGVPSVDVWLDETKLGDAFGDPLVFFWEWPGTEPGTHILRAVARPTSGAEVTSAPVSIHVPDVDAPVVTMLSPPAAGTVQGLIEAAASVEDNVGVTDVKFYLDGSTQLGGTLTAPPYRVALDVSGLSHTTHTVRVVARDAVGNQGEATRSFTVGPSALTPWTRATKAALPPRLMVEIDFENDALYQTWEDALFAAEPWSLMLMEETAVGAVTLDHTGFLHSGTIAGTWALEPGGGFRTTAMSTSTIKVPAPARRQSFSFLALVKPRSFGSSPMTLLDTGGLQIVLRPNGGIGIPGTLETNPGLISAGGGQKFVAVVVDLDTASVGLPARPVRPGPRSYASIFVDGVLAAEIGPLGLAETTLMANAGASLWTIGGGAGDLAIDDVGLFMRALDAAEIQSINSVRTVAASVPPAVWRDVTQWVDGLDPEYGLPEDPLEAPDTGRMNLILKNDDRRFEPDYAGAAYYPYVIPRRRVRVRAWRNGAWQPLWRGYVDNWRPSWSSQRRGIVTVPCVDGRAVIKNADPITADYTVENTGVRINRVLDRVGVPINERTLDTGKLQLAAHRPENDNPLDYIDRAAMSELGYFFYSNDGKATFHDRDHRQTATASVVPRWTFGDGGPSSGELPFTSLEPDYDSEKVVNDVQVNRPAGIEQVAIDGASTTQNGHKSKTIDSLLSSDQASRQIARMVLEMFSQPRWRFPVLEFDPNRLDTLWDVATMVTIGDRIIVRRRPPVNGVPGAAITVACHVNRVKHLISREGGPIEWMVSLALQAVAVEAVSAVTPSVTIVVPAA
jgi:Big-like domain-containing protein